MKIINFGSLNIDNVYSVSHIVSPGETIISSELNLYAGGKGLNQSIAAARAGATVYHMGAIGQNDEFLAELLAASGVKTEKLLRVDGSSGHAIIQVAKSGQNSIIVFGGANQMLTKEYILDCLEIAEEGDIVLLQNETNEIGAIINEAAKKKLHVVFNPSPFPEHPEELPLDKVSTFIVNEVEGAALAGVEETADPDLILERFSRKYPQAQIVLTLGSRGVVCRVDGKQYHENAYRVQAVDTTAAGDTFCGYYLAAQCSGFPVPERLRRASAASAIAVSRSGAAPSIPVREEVDAFLKEHNG